MARNKEVQKLNKEVKKANSKRSINKDILKISVGIAVLFVAMVVYFGYFIEVQAPSAINSTYNKRSASYKEKVVRGTIYDASGKEVLAQTLVDEDGQETRQYPYGSLFSHVVGFESNGGLGLENSYNYYLLSSNINILSKLEYEFTEIKSPGNSIITTLHVGLQQRINELLDSAGNSAAIAIDPETGEILSMVSKPDFDPNTISAIWDDIVADENNSVLLNRATQGLYAPGSTFKIFTLDEYLREHPDNYADYNYFCEGQYTTDDMTLHCYGYTAHGLLDLEKSLAYSCNSSFANIGVSLNIAKFRANNKRLFFNQDLPLDIASSKSSFALEKGAKGPEIIQTAIGQGNTLVTPAHLALVMSAIANDGVLMTPHLVSEVINDDGNTVKTFRPTISDTLFESAENEILKNYLEDVVASGTANILAYSNYTAYGKTGTAETVSNFNADAEAADHSWFVGWAEADGKKLVVCVLIEKAQNTWGSAVQFSKEIFDYYFQ